MDKPHKSSALAEMAAKCTTIKSNSERIGLGHSLRKKFRANARIRGMMNHTCQTVNPQPRISSALQLRYFPLRLKLVFRPTLYIFTSYTIFCRTRKTRSWSRTSGYAW